MTIDATAAEATAADRAVPRERARAIAIPWLDITLCVLLFAAAIVPRTAWIAYNDRSPKGFNDPGVYDIYSDNIADGKGYTSIAANPDGTVRLLDRTAYYPVGYPATVAGLKKAGDLLWWGRSDFSVKMMNGVFGAITVVLVYLLASRVAGRRTGVAAGLLLAVFPSQVFYTGTYLSEPEFTMFFVLGLLVLAWQPWSRDGMSYRQLALAGFVLSCATMVRGITLLLPLLLLLIWLFYLHDRTRAIKQTLVLFAGIAVLIVPWSIRNSIHLDTISGPSTNVGDDLCIGNYRGADGRFTLDPDVPCFEGFEGKLGKELEVGRNRHGTEVAIRDVFQHPLRMPELVMYKLYWLTFTDDDGLWAAESYGHDWFISHPRREILQFAANGIYYATGLVMIAGSLAFAFSRDIRRAFVLLVMLYTLAIPLLFFGDPRFHYPAIPLAVIIAAWTVIAFWERRHLARGEPEPRAVRTQEVSSLEYCAECGQRLLPGDAACPNCGTPRGVAP